MKKIMYHGTSLDNYNKILSTGFLTNTRYHSHKRSVWLTEDYHVAKRFADKVGIDNGVILVINTYQMIKDGICFYDTFHTGIHYETDDISIKYILYTIIV